MSEFVIIQSDLIQVAFLAAFFLCGCIAKKGATPLTRKIRDAATNKGPGV